MKDQWGNEVVSSEVQKLRAELLEVKKERNHLKAAIESCIHCANNRETEWGSRAMASFQYLYDVLEGE